MKQARVLAFWSLGLVLAFAATAGAADRELKLGTASGRLGQDIDVPLRLTADGDVQGIVAAFDWDGSKLKGVDLLGSAAVQQADVIVSRIADSYMVFGVVMDSDGQGGELIPLPTDVVVATATVKALGPSGTVDEIVPLVFQDGLYNTVDLGPLLENIIVIGGLSIGEADGLVLTDGSVRLMPPPPAEFKVESATETFGDPISVRVLMGNQNPVQGYVVALAHAAGLSLTGATWLGAAVTPGSDFQDVDIDAVAGGVVAVVMELDGIPPFRVIPNGTDQPIAQFTYATSSRPCVDAADVAANTEVFALTFVDFVLGDPLQENIVVVDGLSKNPELVNGSVTLQPKACPPPGGAIEIAIGSCDLVMPVTEDPGPGEELAEPWDVKDPTDDTKYLKRPGHIVGNKCGTVDVGIYYKFPPDAILSFGDQPIGGPSDQIHQIQGMSIAVCYDKSCLSCTGSYSLAGTVTDAIGAEFVNVHCEDTDASTGDANRPGELVIGILADALPPFDGQYLPPTIDWLKLICVKFTIPCTATCGGDCSFSFCTANGRGEVDISNLASVWNHSWPMSGIPGMTTGDVTIKGEANFIRGDCNANQLDHVDSADKTAVDIADASAILSFLFAEGDWQFLPPCLDACDANNDGRVDLADSVYVLRYLFKFDRQPPEPFDVPGTDPLPEDHLDCAGGDKC